MRIATFSATGVFLSPAAFAAGDSKLAWYADPTTNAAFAALVVFLFIVWRLGGFNLIFSALDKRAQDIRDQIDEAKQLREEATRLMAEAEQKAKEADQAADEIVRRAKADADALMAEARSDLEAKVARREAQAEQRIARAEQEAMTDVKRAAADAATNAVRGLLSEGGHQSKSFDTALAEVKAKLS